MNFREKLAFLCLILAMQLSVGGCKTTEQSVETQKSSPTGITKTMQDLKATLMNVLPIVIDPVRFKAAENRDLVSKDLKTIRSLSEQVVRNHTLQFSDPTVGFISAAFSTEMRRAEDAFASGKTEYTRYTIMKVTAFCIECHTRSSAGPNFSSPEFSQTLSQLKQFQRGEFLLATRDFGKSFKEFQAVITDNLVKGNNSLELERSIRYALAIAIKVKDDPDMAFAVAKQLSNSSMTPNSLRNTAKSWLNDIKLWKREDSKPAKNMEELIKRVRNLMNQGQKSKQLNAERSGDVFFLRALAQLSKMTSYNLTKDQMGEILYLSGLGYENLGELGVWSLHESYYESCIRRIPHSKWAKSCFAKLEDSVLLGFSGSSGLGVPIDEQLRLEDLKKLSQPQIK